MRFSYLGALVSCLISPIWARTSTEGFVLTELWEHSPSRYSPVGLHVSNAEKIVYSFDQTPPAVTKLNQTDGSLIESYPIPINECWKSPNDFSGTGRDSAVESFAVHSDSAGKPEFFIILVNDMASQRHNGDGRMIKVRASDGEIEWTKQMVSSFLDETDKCTEEEPNLLTRIDIYGGLPVLDSTGTYIYIQLLDLAIACYGTFDGNEFWRTDLDARMSNLALHENGMIYAGKRDDEDYSTGGIGPNIPPTQPTMYTFDASDGNLTNVWTSDEIKEHCEHPALICNGSIRARPVISSDGGFLYVLDVYAGLMKFSIDGSGSLENVYYIREIGPAEPNPVAPALNPDGSVLYGVSESGTPTAWSTADGAVVWETDQMWTIELSVDVQYHHGIVFYSYDNDNLFGIFAQDGTVRLRTNDQITSNAFGFSEDDTVVYILDHTLDVSAYSLLPPTPAPTPSPTTPIPTLVGATNAPTAPPTTAPPTAPPTTAPPRTPIPTLFGLSGEPTPAPDSTEELIEEPTPAPTEQPTATSAARFGGGVCFTVILMFLHYLY